MSVLVTLKFAGDTDVFRTAVETRAAELKEIAERAKAVGAIHHRFGVGDGVVVVVDEWESAEDFEKFFADPNMQAFVASVGADFSVPLEMTIPEALSTPDEF